MRRSGVVAARTDRRDQGQKGHQQACLGGTLRGIQAVEQMLGSQPRGACRTAWGERAGHCLNREELVRRPRGCYVVAVL